MPTKEPRDESPGTDLDETRKLLAMLREMGVTRAAFCDGRLLEVELAPFVPDAEAGDLSSEPEARDAAWRLANRGATRGVKREES